MLFTKGGVNSGNGLVRLLQVERIPIKRDVLYIATGGVRPALREERGELLNVTKIQFIWYYSSSNKIPTCLIKNSISSIVTFEPLS